LWQNPHLIVSTTKGETMLSVTLRRLKVEDHRSFGRYLFDIASGANEERPRGRYFIKQLHGTGSKLPGRSAEQKLLCLYRIEKCS